MLTGDGLKDTFLPYFAAVFVVILAGYLLAAFAQKGWGTIVTIIVVAAAIVGFIVFPEQGLQFLQNLWTAVWR